MGARGALKLAPESPTVVSIRGTAAEKVKPLPPTKPDNLDPEISDLWDQLISHLEAAGMVGGMDGPTIVLALEQYALARRCADDLRTRGLHYTDKNGHNARNPTAMILNSATEQFVKLAGTLGLSFISRARAANASKADDDVSDNPFL